MPLCPHSKDKRTRQASVTGLDTLYSGPPSRNAAPVPGSFSDSPPWPHILHVVVGGVKWIALPRAGTYMNLVRPDTTTSILVLGDSFCRIYQLPEPQSLGESPDAAGKEEADPTPGDSGRTKRLLPGSAGFPSHHALAMGTTVDYIVSDGGAATDVRRELSTNGEILEGTKIVIWEFVERDIALGAKGWQAVPLPPKLPGM